MNTNNLYPTVSYHSLLFLKHSSVPAILSLKTVIVKNATSGQDGGLGKYGLPPCITTSKLQLNCETTIIRNCQKSSRMAVRQLQS